MRNHVPTSLSSAAGPRWLRRATAAVLGLGLSAGALNAAPGASAATTPAQPHTLATSLASPHSWSLAGDFLRQWNATGGPANTSASTWQYFSVPSAEEGTPADYSLLGTAYSGESVHPVRRFRTPA